MGFGPPPYEPKKPKAKAASKGAPGKPAVKAVADKKSVPASKPTKSSSSVQSPKAAPAPSVPKPNPLVSPVKTKGATFGDLTPGALESIEFWIGRGWADFKAIAVTAHAQVESYPELRTEVVGDKHIAAKDGIPAGSVGIYQWNSVRKKGLFDYAKRTGQDPYARVCQLEWAGYELNTTEKFAGDELAKAITLWEAVRAWMHYERPKGWTKTNPTNGSHWGKRLDTAIKLRDNYRKYVAWKAAQVAV